MNNLTTPIDMESAFEGRDIMFILGGAGGGFVISKIFKQNVILFTIGGAIVGFLYSKFKNK